MGKVLWTALALQRADSLSVGIEIVSGGRELGHLQVGWMVLIVLKKKKVW